MSERIRVAVALGPPPGVAAARAPSKDGKIALVAKMHHSTVDGVSGAELLGVLFDLEPQPPESPVGAENPIPPAQATSRYSWMSPPRTSVRRMPARSGSAIGAVASVTTEGHR